MNIGQHTYDHTSCHLKITVRKVFTVISKLCVHRASTTRIGIAKTWHRSAAAGCGKSVDCIKARFFISKRIARTYSIVGSRAIACTFPRCTGVITLTHACTLFVRQFPKLAQINCSLKMTGCVGVKWKVNGVTFLGSNISAKRFWVKIIPMSDSHMIAAAFRRCWF